MSNESNWDRPDDYVREQKADGFAPVPEGNYTAVIDRVEAKKTQKSEMDYLNVTLKVSDGNYLGRLVWAKYYYSERAINILWDMLADIEQPNIKPSQLLESDSERGKLIDIVVSIYVKHDEYKGKTQAKANIRCLASENTAAAFVPDEEDMPF